MLPLECHERFTIAQADPAARIARYRGEIDAAMADVVDAGRYVLGPTVETFEREFAAYLGVEHCIGVNSGTDALTLSLMALGIGSGDEVITTALSAAGTAQAILHCGATPIFVDVDPATRCLDPYAVENAVDARTAAIVPVHLFGYPADLARLVRIASRHRLALIEDCAHAHGTSIGAAKVGTFGDAGAFSFYPTKNLGGIGDGGAIVTRNAALAHKMRALRNYGWDRERVSQTRGFNSRLDELQAGILRVLLRHLDDGNRARRQLALGYRCLVDANVALPPDDPGCVYHQFAITVLRAKRTQLRHFLSNRAGIETAIHYDPPLHLQPAFATNPPARLPHTELLSQTLLSLPIQPEVAGPYARYITDSIRGGLRSCSV